MHLTRDQHIHFAHHTLLTSLVLELKKYTYFSALATCALKASTVAIAASRPAAYLLGMVEGWWSEQSAPPGWRREEAARVLDRWGPAIFAPLLLLSDHA